MNIISKLCKNIRKRILRDALQSEEIQNCINECIERTLKTGNEHGFKVYRHENFRSDEDEKQLVYSDIIEGGSHNCPLNLLPSYGLDFVDFHTHPLSESGKESMGRAGGFEMSKEDIDHIFRLFGFDLSYGDMRSTLWQYINMKKVLDKAQKENKKELEIVKEKLLPPIGIKIFANQLNDVTLTAYQFVSPPPYTINEDNGKSPAKIRIELQNAGCLNYAVLEYNPEEQEYESYFPDDFNTFEVILDKFAESRLDLPDEDVLTMQKKYLGIDE